MHVYTRIVAEQRAQRDCFIVLQFAQDQSIVRAQGVRRQQWRARIDPQIAIRIERKHRVDVALQRWRCIRQVEQTQDALTPFAGLVRWLVIQQVAAGTRVRVEIAERLVLGRECVQQSQHYGVLEHVGEISGMEGVFVIHARIVRCRAQRCELWHARHKTMLIACDICSIHIPAVFASS